MRMRNIPFPCINNSLCASSQPYHELLNSGALSQLLFHIYDSFLNSHIVTKDHNSLSKSNLSWSPSAQKCSLANFFLITLCLLLLLAKYTHHHFQPCSSQSLNNGVWSSASFSTYHFISFCTAASPAQICR